MKVTFGFLNVPRVGATDLGNFPKFYQFYFGAFLMKVRDVNIYDCDKDEIDDDDALGFVTRKP